MLIVCEKHTKADLELWADYAEIDAANALRPQLQKKIEQSLRVIKSFAQDSCYIGVSWGKDSVVLAHLAERAAPHLPLVNLRYGIHPYIDAVRDSYLERLNQKYIEKSVPPRVSKRQKMQRFDIANNFFGTERHLSGLRIDEKGIRQLSIKAQGLITKNSCRPLGYWSTEDVFAYLTLHNLPVHPNYAMLGGGRFDRNYIRVGSIGGHRGTNLGRREWEQEYYPEFALR